ncbi:MAG: tRNA guanosine(34) transglycosylase Tgt [Planctomycetes bacterium]|nr:tRNA guanosine(34) transglycosylase Tgt [Planctomycetota bacterium]
MVTPPRCSFESAVEPVAVAGPRLGRLTTAHGVVETPTFMPVGTQACVKGLAPDQVRATGSRMILGNTYHLALRPGAERVRALGGLHAFMGWNHPILTDSGGFQIFSLADRARVTECEVEFRSHLDGRSIRFSPERAIAIQEDLGSDIAMVLDHVVGLPAPIEQVRDACERSIRWAERCLAARSRSDQGLFAIVQGGLDADLRVDCARRLAAMPFDGFAIGGLSVGESAEDMRRVLDVTCPVLPAHRPRYLMGVGTPEDLLDGIARGIDLFDCVLPTRNGRNGMAFTDRGPLKVRNAKHQDDPGPLDPDTPSAASGLSRAYLRHLFLAGEMLGPILLTCHNLAYYQRLMADARRAIAGGSFAEFHRAKREGWTRRGS